MRKMLNDVSGKLWEGLEGNYFPKVNNKEREK